MEFKLFQSDFRYRQKEKFDWINQQKKMKIYTLVFMVSFVFLIVIASTNAERDNKVGHFHNFLKKYT